MSAEPSNLISMIAGDSASSAIANNIFKYYNYKNQSSNMDN